MKWSGIAAGTAALVPAVTRASVAIADDQSGAKAVGGGDSHIVWNACLANCGSRCPLRLEVKDGTVVRILPDSTGSDEFGDFNIRACVRGRNQRERIYSPDRIKRPMKRVGKRGEGKWEEIEWDEALDTVASELKRIKRDFGNEAIWLHYGTGTEGGNMTQRGTWQRLLNLYGGYLRYYGSYSAGQIVAANPYQYGEYTVSNSFQDARHSQLQVMFGNNPLENRMSGGGELMVTQKTRKEYGLRTIVIDPLYSDTAIGLGDEWVPIRPGTDAALIAAMVHVMLEEDLHDQDFLDKYCSGFDEDHLPEGAPKNASYRAYVEGNGDDGVEKTPEWAADITGIPAQKIRQLAREIAGAKPCAITQGLGLQRASNGENQCRAVMTLAAVTGNIGIPGGGTGGMQGSYYLPIAMFPMLTEDPPVKTAISNFNWIDAIDHGPEMTALRDGVQGKDKLETGIKMMVLHSSNTLINQHSDIHHTQEVLADDSKCEFIVAMDHQWTPSCDWADLVLPSTTNFEEEDLFPGAECSETGWTILGSKAIEPLYDSRTGYDICTEVAKRLGFEEEFTEGRTQAEWRSWMVDETRKEVPDLPTEEELEKVAVYRQVNPDHYTVPLKDFRKDPDANALATPSGKIEIYSSPIAEMAKSWVFEGEYGDDQLTALPEYIATWEGPEEARDSKYPIQCIGHHYKGRTHSSYANLPRNKEAHPQMVWINQLDADERGISNGDQVLVFNGRGTVRIEARVSERIAPGVASLPQGAWYQPDEDGIDIGGCINTLTKYHPSPLAKANPSHTALVEIKKA